MLKNIARPILEKVKKFKDIHKGESCYLFGDGISLKYFDLNKFSDKISIPCGFLLFHNDYNSLQVPYSMLIETYYFYPFIRENYLKNGKPVKKISLNHIQNEYRKEMKRRSSTEFFLNLSNYPVCYDKNITYLYKDIPDNLLDSNHISKKFNCYTGSLRAQILLAIYMGFDHVYLVGHDYTHSPAISHHWYEKGQGVITPMPDFSKEFLNYAKEFINITTITTDSGSDNLNYIKYEDFFDSKMIFRENNELLSEEFLEVLSTYSGYRVY